MKHTFRIASLGLLGLVWSGCGDQNAAVETSAPTVAPSEQPDERTRDAAALDAIGLDGAKLRSKIDTAIHAEEERRQQAADESEK